MKIDPTRRAGRFAALAEELAGGLRERAAGYDERGEFPHRNLAELRTSGYLTLTVPEELGGLGGDLTDMVVAQERLAAGCGSTALVVNMHLSMTGQLARAWRATRSERAEELLRGTVAGTVFLAGATAEPGHALVRTTGSKAVRIAGGYRVTGKKTFGTGTAAATHLTSMAVDEDHSGGPHVLIFRVPATAPGLTVRSGTWHTSGMRATCSDDVDLQEVEVPDDAISLRFPEGSLDGTLLQTLWGWAMPSFGAVYLGIAVGALEQCIRDTRRRGGQHRAFAQSVIAECEVLVETARAVIARTAEEMMGNSLWTTLDIQEGMARVVTAKLVGTNNAVSILDRVVQLVGSPALKAGSLYDRAQRDVRAGTMHPYSNADAQELIAATAFGIPVAPINPPLHTDLPITADAQRGDAGSERLRDGAPP